jgi:hypothetical protein
MSVLSLNDDVLVHCFSYLTPEELCRCNSICKAFSSSVHHPTLWKYWLISFGVISIEYPPGYPLEQQQNTYMDCFIAWKLSFPHYSMHDVRQTKIWWSRFSSWCASYAPEILLTLNPPATESQLNSIETHFIETLPLSLRLFYRFHNGQTIPFDLDRNTHHNSLGWGLFGGTHYYDSFVNLRFVSLDSLREITHSCRRTEAQILPHLKLHGFNPTEPTNGGVGGGGVGNENQPHSLYYDDDEINGPFSNQLLSDSLDQCSDLITFAVSAPRPSKVYCIGNGNSPGGGTVYVNTSK